MIYMEEEGPHELNVPQHVETTWAQKAVETLAEEGQPHTSPPSELLANQYPTHRPFWQTPTP